MFVVFIVGAIIVLTGLLAHVARRDTMTRYEEEIKLEEYDDTFSDYAEMVLQYGYVCLFVAAFPLAPFLALIENIIEIRVDAYKMLYLVRRPVPTGAEDIGTWGEFLEIMGTMALLTNAAIISFTTIDLAHYGLTTKFLIFLCAEHILLVCKVILHKLIPDMPTVVQNNIKRHEHVQVKHKLGAEGDDDGPEEDDDGLEGGAIESEDLLVEMGGSTGGSGGGDSHVIQSMRVHMSELDAKIKTATLALQAAKETEFFNPSSGIGESREGHPLGHLVVTLVEARNLPQGGFGSIDPYVALRIDPLDAGPDRPQLSEIKRRTTSPEWGQDFVLQPITSKYASLCVRVCDYHNGGSDDIIGEIMIPLTDLEDQAPHDEWYPLPCENRQQQQQEDASESGEPAVHLRLQFQYSKIVPLQNRLNALKAKRDEINRRMKQLVLAGDAAAV